MRHLTPRQQHFTKRNSWSAPNAVSVLSSRLIIHSTNLTIVYASRVWHIPINPIVNPASSVTHQKVQIIRLPLWNCAPTQHSTPNPIQFGSCLPRLFETVWEVDPADGPIWVSKWDLSDAFHRCCLHPEDIHTFSYIAPPHSPPTPNPSSVLTYVIENMFPSLVETKVASLFDNTNDMAALHKILSNRVHLQPPSPVTNTTKCTEGIINDTVEQIKPNAVDMRY